MGTTVAGLVAEAKTRIENLTVEQVAGERSTGDPLLVDIREPEERARTGMIAGAIAAPRGLLEWLADPASALHRPEFSPERRTILYCASGGRSALAADALGTIGYASVAHLEPGIGGWLAAGQPVVADPAQEPNGR